MAEGFESAAVVFLHSYANAEHERAAARHLAERAPNLAVSASCDVSPRIREYERTSTTLANAYVKPIVARYLDTLQEALTQQGFTGSLHVMQSNGGLVTPEIARDYPVRIVESGPAAGVLLARHVGQLEATDHVLTFDMGGTTAKLGVVDGGEPVITSSFEVDTVDSRRYSGLPISTPAIELLEIGAGGGSIATTDGHTIQVGPRSAGADPGPICYGGGGDRSTVTDANLVLGYLDPGYFNGGAMTLDLDAARSGLQRDIADPLGLALEDAAWGIHAVANAGMERAMRVMSVEKGRDPRKYTLVAFGGAGTNPCLSHRPFIGNSARYRPRGSRCWFGGRLADGRNPDRCDDHKNHDVGDGCARSDRVRLCRIGGIGGQGCITAQFGNTEDGQVRLSAAGRAGLRNQRQSPGREHRRHLRGTRGRGLSHDI